MEKETLQGVIKTGYKEKIKELCKVLADSKGSSAVSLVDGAVDSFIRYFNAVLKSELKHTTAGYLVSGSEYREIISELDHSRSTVHNAAISNLNMLNRMCVQNGLEPLFTGDTADRVAVGDFCGEFCKEWFDKRLR